MDKFIPEIEELLKKYSYKYNIEYNPRKIMGKGLPIIHLPNHPNVNYRSLYSEENIYVILILDSYEEYVDKYSKEYKQICDELQLITKPIYLSKDFKYLSDGAHDNFEQCIGNDIKQYSKKYEVIRMDNINCKVLIEPKDWENSTISNLVGIIRLFESCSSNINKYYIGKYKVKVEYEISKKIDDLSDWYEK